MFAFFNRSRRHVAVLTALAMVASVLVAAPAVAADDPKPSLEATFTACVDIDPAGFTDVPAAHANAGDIDCIAYYGITQGTGDNAYSPRSGVSREHMALFLTRLAGRVGIEMTDNPGDPGFTDIGGLPAMSQTAIAQLFDLKITEGTGIGTYSPADMVKRGDMALFLTRMMNLMTPYGGDDSTDASIPSDVDDLDRDDAGTPFTDLRSVTVLTDDAITALYELGIASGISATAYAPTADITRAAMAEFMVGVLGHSNVRPAGVSIQASKTSGFGPISDATVIISVRDDSFAAVADQAVDHFKSEADNGGLDDGACSNAVDFDCEWTEDDEFTNADGNLALSGEGATEGETNVYYTWIGAEDGDEFDANDVDYASVTITSKKDEEALKATSTINKEATNNQVDLDKVSSVTITVQLVDMSKAADADEDTLAGPGDDAKAVARSGQDITVSVTRSADANSDGAFADEGADEVFSSTNVATLTTDDDGKVTYTVDAPEDDNDNNDTQDGDVTGTNQDGADIVAEGALGLEDRTDVIKFTYDDGNDGAPTVALTTFTIRWSEANPVTAKVVATANAYVIAEADGDARVSAIATFYDQYGNGYRKAAGQKIGINFDTEEKADGELATPEANVQGNGIARRGTTLEGQTPGMPIPVVYVEDPTEDPDVDVHEDVDDDLDGPNTIQVVTEAETDDAGRKDIHTLYADDNKFTTEAGGTDSNVNANKLYSYDSDDTFIMDGESITMDKFEELLANPDDDDANPAVINVVIYNPDGLSIFDVLMPPA